MEILAENSAPDTLTNGTSFELSPDIDRHSQRVRVVARGHDVGRREVERAHRTRGHLDAVRDTILLGAEEDGFLGEIVRYNNVSQCIL